MVRQRTSSGFVLPVILLISTGLMIVGLSLIQSTGSMRESLRDNYFNQIAKEASEAGIAYANYCLSANAYAQSWGPAESKPALTQKTDCNGATIASAPDNLMTNNTYYSSFSVGDLEVRSDGAIIISASGTAQQKSSAGSTATRSYTAARKQVVQWKTYQASVSSSGTSKTCSIISGELYCWGKNSNDGTGDFSGQLGNGTNIDSLTPVKVRQDPGILSGKVVDDVSSAQYHNCALAAGKVYCWGRNPYGQLGDGTQIDRYAPVEVGGALAGKTVTHIATTGDLSCAIAEGKIYCWGRNSQGTIGVNTTTTFYTSPIQVVTSGVNPDLPTNYIATMLASSGSRSLNMCALADGKVYCWGMNDAGSIGNGVANTTDLRKPTKVVDTGVLAGKTITALTQDGFTTSSGFPHVCVVASGAAYCWGENIYGQLGNGNTTDSSVPIAVSTSGVLAGKTVQDIVAGVAHTCALADSKVYCWGSGSSGQLGNSTNTTTQSTPIAVSELSGGLLGRTVTAIGGGANRGCAIADYQSYCWGLNSEGQIGDGTQTNRNRPTESIFLRPKAPTFLF